MHLMLFLGLKRNIFTDKASVGSRSAWLTQTAFFSSNSVPDKCKQLLLISCLIPNSEMR